MATLPLHSTHEQSSAQFGERGGREIVRRFGTSLGDEYQAARSGAVLADCSFRDALRITGDDRLSFLHGMCTNDIKGLAEGGSVYTTFVTVKGAMVSDGRVIRRADDVIVDLEPGSYEKVREFLEKFLISEDAELLDAREDVAVLSLVGPRTFDVLERAFGVRLKLERSRVGPPGQTPSPGTPEHHATRAEPSSFEVDGQRLFALASLYTRGDGVDLLLPRPALPTLWKKLVDAEAMAVGQDALELVRVEDGIPRFGQDLLETTIPLEAELLHAISYNKGCYVGQEVIARATFRGAMNKKLVRLSLGEHDVAPGTDLRVNDKKIGVITSVIRSPGRGEFVALGYVHRAHLAPGTQVDALGTPARVLPLVESASTAQS